MRDALLAAIKQLRQPEDVEEPTSAAQTLVSAWALAGLAAAA